MSHTEGHRTPKAPGVGPEPTRVETEDCGHTAASSCVGLRPRQKGGAGDALRDTLQKVVDEDAGCGGKQRKPGPAGPAWRGITEWGGGDGPWKRGPTLLGDAAKFRIPLT